MQRGELDVDHAVVTAVAQRGHRKLQLIAGERVRAELTQDVGPDEEVRDPEGAPLRIPEYGGRDHRCTVLHRVPGRFRGREGAGFVRTRRDTRHRPARLEIDEECLLEAAPLLHEKAR